MVNKSDNIDRWSSRVLVDIITQSHSSLLDNSKSRTHLLLLLVGLSTALSASLLLALALLQEGLGDEDLVLGGDGAVFGG